MGSKEFYEEMYSDPANRKQKLSFLYRKLRRFELNRYDLTCQVAPGGDSLLDIGCGDGELLILLRDKYKELWGIDIAQPRIDRISQKIGGDSNIHVRVEDVERRIDFEDERFSTILAVGILEHVFAPYHIMQECRRLLRQKGTLIATVPNVAYLPNRVKLLFGKLPVTSNSLEGCDGGHLHYFTRASLIRLFKEEGFEVVKITSSGIFAMPRRIWGSLLAGDILIQGIKK